MQPHSLEQNEGSAFWFLNSLILIKSTPESTGSPSAILHQTISPSFSTPYHQHRSSDDSFYILEGEVTFFSDGQKIALGPGGYIFLPRGYPHGFRNDSGKPASMLVIVTPAEEFQGLLHDAGESAKELILPPPMEPDRQKMATLSAKWGMDIVGPLPAE